jgi:hypothetical protein
LRFGGLGGLHFTIIGDIHHIKTIAVGGSVQERNRLRKLYGSKRWRKLRGIATVSLADGTICEDELHWYEADGTGRKEVKIK